MLYLIDFMQNPSENISTSQATTGVPYSGPYLSGVFCLRAPRNNCCRSFTTARESEVRKEAAKGCFQYRCNPSGMKQAQTSPGLCTTNCSLYSMCDTSEITNPPTRAVLVFYDTMLLRGSCVPCCHQALLQRLLHCG